MKKKKKSELFGWQTVLHPHNNVSLDAQLWNFLTPVSCLEGWWYWTCPRWSGSAKNTNKRAVWYVTCTCLQLPLMIIFTSLNPSIDFDVFFIFYFSAKTCTLLWCFYGSICPGTEDEKHPHPQTLSLCTVPVNNINSTIVLPGTNPSNMQRNALEGILAPSHH